MDESQWAEFSAGYLPRPEANMRVEFSAGVPNHRTIEWRTLLFDHQDKVAGLKFQLGPDLDLATGSS